MPTSSDSKLLHLWPYLSLVLLLEAAFALVVIAPMGWDIEGVRLLARCTARLSLSLFLLSFLADSLAFWFPSDLTRNLKIHKRSLLLGFALAHVVHLGILISSFVLAGETPSLTTVLAGGFGYLLLILMTITANDAAQRRLRSAWIGLQRFGLYYLWFNFAITYVTRYFEVKPVEPRWVYIGFCVLLAAALALRLVTALKNAENRPI